MVALLKQALYAGRAEIERRLLQHPSSGRIAASATAFLIDQIVRLSHDFTTGHLYPSANRSAGERITLIAVGGYGRGEIDRTRVVSGKSVSVSVDLGGRRIVKKKKKKEHTVQ